MRIKHLRGHQPPAKMLPKTTFRLHAQHFGVSQNAQGNGVVSIDSGLNGGLLRRQS
ncbi:hypothetical protein [Hymenobacter siberiensis]|uniref:hypothetical protein n=1 Tax=Hymenobacter siberiensis TaxID=2848396 RepID=UPI001C1E4D81|nr:hypothetical protein [Hymenobacter siberiensis]